MFVNGMSLEWNKHNLHSWMKQWTIRFCVLLFLFFLNQGINYCEVMSQNVHQEITIKTNHLANIHHDVSVIVLVISYSHLMLF